MEEIEKHRAFLKQSGKLEHFEENKSAIHFIELLKERLFRRVYQHISTGDHLDNTIRAIARRELDPYTAVEEILKERLK